MKLKRYFTFLALLVTVTSLAQTNHPHNSGPTSVTVATGATINYFDSGGASNYLNQANPATSVITFAPASPNQKVRVTFNSFSVESAFDALYIYNGNVAETPDLTNTAVITVLPNQFSSGNAKANTFRAGGFWGSNLPPIITSSAASGALTFQFDSDTSVPSPGWSAQITTYCNPNNTLSDYRIAHTCTNGSTTEVINTYDSESLTNPFFEFNVCADGTNASTFELIFDSGNNTCIDAFKLRLEEDPNGSNPDQYGSFGAAMPTPGGGYEFEYQHPKMLPLSNNSPYADYTLQLVELANPNNVIEEIDFRVYRVPVLMVHGLWGDDGSFSGMKAVLDDDYYEDFMLYRANYSGTHAAHFATNANVVPNAINQLINRMKDHEIAVAKVDAIGHSMGGILIRLYQQGSSFAQDIARVITLNTPHSGSQLADMLLDNGFVNRQKVVDWLHFAKKYTNLGAVADLRVEGDAIREDLNGGNQSFDLLRSHAIVTHYDCPQPTGVFEKASYCGALWAYMNVGQLYGGDPNDLIVEDSSQRGGLPAVTILQDIHHLGSPNQNPLIDTTLKLLRQPVNSASFSMAGFNPPELNYVRPDPFKAPTTSQEESLATINFTQPANNSVFSPGNVVNFTVAGSPDLTEINVVIAYSNDSLFIARQMGNTFSASFTMDAVSGERRVVAIGRTATGTAVLDSLTFFVCPSDLNVNNQVISTGSFSAANTISSNGSIEDASEVNFKAGVSITLSPGFFVEQGAALSATIGDCDASSNLSDKPQTEKGLPEK